MAFPTTGILDTGTRADEGPPPSASWTVDITGEGSSSLFIASNAFSTSSSGTGWWNVSTFGADSEVYYTIATRGSSTLRAYLRIVDPATAGVDGYMIFNATGGQTRIYRYDDQTLTQLGADATETWANGDSFGGEAIGTTLTLYKKTAGVWASVVSRSDSTYSAAGYIGMGNFSSAATYTDFGGGTVVTAATNQLAWIKA